MTSTEKAQTVLTDALEYAEINEPLENLFESNEEKVESFNRIDKAFKTMEETGEVGEEESYWEEGELSNFIGTAEMHYLLSKLARQKGDTDQLEWSESTLRIQSKVWKFFAKEELPQYILFTAENAV